MMILRLNTLLKGHSGATLELVRQLQFFINERIIPIIPQQGSLGASGDLAPLSHLALALIGQRGKYCTEGKKKRIVTMLLELNRQPLNLPG